MLIIFAYKKQELKEKTQDANFTLPIKSPNPLGIKKRIPDSKIGQKLGGFRIANPINYMDIVVNLFLFFIVCFDTVCHCSLHVCLVWFTSLAILKIYHYFQGGRGNYNVYLFVALYTLDTFIKVSDWPANFENKKRT